MAASNRRAIELKRDVFSAFDEIILDVQRLERETYSQKILCEKLTTKIKELDVEESKVLERTKALYAKGEENFQKELDAQVALESTMKTLQLDKQRRAGLRHQLERSNTEAIQQKQRLAAKEDKYRAIWDSYKAVYESFPLVKEVDRMSAIVQHDNIKLIQANSDLRMSHNKIVEMGKINAMAIKIESVALAKICVEHAACERHVAEMQRQIDVYEATISQGMEQKQRLLPRLKIKSANEPVLAAVPQAQVAALPVASNTGRQVDERTAFNVIGYDKMAMQSLPQVPMMKATSRQASLDMVRARYARTPWHCDNDNAVFSADKNQLNNTSALITPVASVGMEVSPQECQTSNTVTPAEPGQTAFYSQDRSKPCEMQMQVEYPAQDHAMAIEIPSDVSEMYPQGASQGNKIDLQQDEDLMDCSSQVFLQSNKPPMQQSSKANSSHRLQPKEVPMEYFTQPLSQSKETPMEQSSMEYFSQPLSQSKEVPMEQTTTVYSSQHLSQCKEIPMEYTSISSQRLSQSNEVLILQKETCLSQISEVQMHQSGIKSLDQGNSSNLDVPMPIAGTAEPIVRTTPSLRPTATIDSGDNENHFIATNIVPNQENLGHAAAAMADIAGARQITPGISGIVIRPEVRVASGSSSAEWPLSQFTPGPRRQEQATESRTDTSSPVFQTGFLSANPATGTTENDLEHAGRDKGGLDCISNLKESEDNCIEQQSCSQKSISEGMSRMEYMKKLKQSPEFFYAPRLMFKRQEVVDSETGSASPYFQSLISEANACRKPDNPSIPDNLSEPSDKQSENKESKLVKPQTQQMITQLLQSQQLQAGQFPSQKPPSQQFPRQEQVQRFPSQEQQVQQFPRQEQVQRYPSQEQQVQQFPRQEQVQRFPSQEQQVQQFPSGQSQDEIRQIQPQSHGTQEQAYQSQMIPEEGTTISQAMSPSKDNRSEQQYTEEQQDQLAANKATSIDPPRELLNQNQQQTPRQFMDPFNEEQHPGQLLSQDDELFYTPGHFRSDVGAEVGDNYGSPLSVFPSSAAEAAEIHDSSSNESFHYNSPNCSPPPPEPAGFGFMGSGQPHDPPMFGAPAAIADGKADTQEKPRSEAFTFNFSSNSNKPSVFKLF